MSNKPLFSVAAIFLGIAIIAPIVIFTIQADNDLDNIINYQNPNGMQTGNNITIPTTEQIQESHTVNLIIVIATEVVFVSLFSITIYYALNKKTAITE